MKKLFYMMVGGLTAGVFWGCFECMWIYLKPILPFDLLKYQRVSPPEDIFYSFLFSILTYSILSISIILSLFLLFKITTKFFSRFKVCHKQYRLSSTAPRI